MAVTNLPHPSAGTPDAERLRLPGEFIEACNVLALKTRHLAALTTSMIGEGFETFSAMGDSYQHDLLALAADLAHDIDAASRVINGFDSEMRNHG